MATNWILFVTCTYAQLEGCERVKVGTVAQEIELKLLLADHADYVTVLTALSHLATAEVQDQTNYYLDTNRLNLRASRAMLRVRVQGQQAKVTVKAKATLQDGIQQALELEQNLPPEIAQAWCKTPPSHSTPATLAVLPWLCGSEAVLQPPLPVDAALHVLGAMQTTRRCFFHCAQRVKS